MFSEQFFELILDFGDEWNVKRVYVNTQKDEVDIFIEHDANLAENPSTREDCPIYDHAPSRRWRHLDTMQFKTFINCCVPRIKDRSGKVMTVNVPWADPYERHTYLFESLAIDILRGTKNQTKTSELLRCGFNVINRIIHNSVKRGMGKRPKGYCFEHLSIDEKSFKKGHKYVTVLSDPISGVVVEVTENRDSTSSKQILKSSVKEEHRAKVKTVTMDMWKPYLSATKEILPNAEIVHDRFHLVKYLNDAMDKVRRREVKKHEELKNTKYIFLKNTEKQTEKQRVKFKCIASANFEVSRAWQVKENFRDIFGCKTINEAFSLVFQWVRYALGVKIKEVTKVIETFQRHLSGIVNAMVSTFSNAMAERLNGKIQEVKSCGRGYRRFEKFRSAILFFHGGLNLYPLK